MHFLKSNPKIDPIEETSSQIGNEWVDEESDDPQEQKS